MKAEAVQRVKDSYGGRATDSRLERFLYSRDLAPVPALLVDPLFKTVPDLIVRPDGSEEVSEVLRLASESGFPVTPRAGASTVYFDSVPIRGGVVMDLNLIKGVVALDEAGMAVTVRSGTTWSELDEYLNPRGFSSLAYPSSAPAATVGGWFCMMGYGIGSLKYGGMKDQVKSIEVVLPSGKIHQATPGSDPPLDWFAASEGTLGVVTQLEIRIRRKNPMRHFLIHVKDPMEMTMVLTALVDAGVVPYNLHFSTPQYIRELHLMGSSPEGIGSGCLIQADYEGNEDELKLADEVVYRVAECFRSAVVMPSRAAEEEWEDRFRSLKLKRMGPSVLGGEIWLPLSGLDSYLDGIQKVSESYGIDLISYGHVVSPEHATVMTMFYSDETRTLRYIIDLSLVKKIQDVGYRHGGVPYGVGLWNTPYINRLFDPTRRSELLRRKQQLDPRGIMNPGKVYRPPALMNPLFFGIGMDVLAGVWRVFGRGWSR